MLRAGSATQDLLAEVFATEGIPYALQRDRRLGDSALGRALIGLLRCAAPRPTAGASGGEEAQLGDLLAWLRSPGLLERPELADQLELRARRSGLVERSRGPRAVGGAPLAA